MDFRSRAFLLTAAVILAAGIAALYASWNRDRGSAPAFNATIDRDCAPWDGSAFIVSIPYDPAATLTISIWQAPDLLFPASFPFPDDTGQIGFAYTAHGDLLQPLAGRVTFARVQPDAPVQGEFHLQTEDGVRYDGKFTAMWRTTAVMCG